LLGDLAVTVLITQKPTPTPLWQTHLERQSQPRSAHIRPPWRGTRRVCANVNVQNPFRGSCHASYRRGGLAREDSEHRTSPLSNHRSVDGKFVCTWDVTILLPQSLRALSLVVRVSHASSLVSDHTCISLAHARPLHPAAWAFVPYGVVLVQVRVKQGHGQGGVGMVGLPHRPKHSRS